MVRKMSGGSDHPSHGRLRRLMRSVVTNWVARRHVLLDHFQNILVRAPVTIVKLELISGSKTILTYSTSERAAVSPSHDNGVLIHSRHRLRKKTLKT